VDGGRESPSQQVGEGIAWRGCVLYFGGWATWILDWLVSWTLCLVVGCIVIESWVVVAIGGSKAFGDIGMLLGVIPIIATFTLTHRRSQASAAPDY
jgi:hypothetical protein